MHNPLVSIISINYNQAQLTCDMVSSLQKITYPTIEIIVIDNASPSEDPQIISDKHPHITLIRSDKNLGFSGGNNLGIKAARGKYLLFLNNDTEVDPGFLEPLVEHFEDNPKTGIASPKIIFYGTDQRIQYAGCTGINVWTGRGKIIGYLEKDLGQHNGCFNTGLIHGAAMMVSRSVIEKAGLMPELYFLYYEEHDWALMIKRAGFESHYIGTSTIYHKESMSVGKSSVLKTFYMNRNRLVFIRRNYKGKHLLASSLFFFGLALPKNIMKHMVKGDFSHAKAILKGILWNVNTKSVNQNHYLPVGTETAARYPIDNMKNERYGSI
ncbi:glycosyltransferase family 2 protein [Anditalea andensis]|uniref:Glycosyltransferase 2-like domain-containing protein n=1 Tax=Anditalea andensis TaxID=1048983 RepID=A0A074L1Y4_9BACT|nr:glycosyltransferase family 2 protein [Anditalea andensis]KEO75149.1 hypothetical protein EL17_05630 [Anditalea andensis]